MQRNGSEILSTADTSQEATLTSDQSLTYAPTTCAATINATFLPVSEDGRVVSGLPDGTIILLHSPPPALVSRFRALESGKAMPTNDTSGPLFTASSPSARLQLSLENRLRAKMGVNGSPEFVLTWKHWDMPAGAPICALRASARPTSANGFTGWPTPVANDDNKSPEAHLAMKARMGGGRKKITSLQVAAKAWPPPMAGTPAQHGYNRAGNNDSSRKTVEIAKGWATPRAIDGRTKGNGPRPDTLTGQTHYGKDRKRLAGGVLNPAFASWLMGFPEDWISCAPSAMPSSRKSRRNSSVQP